MTIDGQWYGVCGASQVALAALREAAPQGLPEEYFQLLAFSNGGEGPLHVRPLILVLDSAQCAADPERIAFYAQTLPGLFVFGSNGVGDFIAFDLRGASPPWPVVWFDAVEPEDSIQLIAADFVQFMAWVGKE
ncbi:SMI1/KNR4 family protein [Pseudomonas syringae]|nr:SMI1/KNR4 family protein [Pseudomonas syringae]MBD8573210.1 SMI1/KNR4 family protein [Pseudomonas syringae]MBD8790278.1 SMI1/KNR4 family protein [Pseudomonas syringae]MBD8799224.1 SMI1/KNR4 family protein [Pseudomonas syringae]MBD8810050.1 SMI1/KNR4 family protein [Pseudomonas syringae]